MSFCVKINKLIEELNLTILELESSSQDDLALVTRLENILDKFTDYIIQTALDEVNDALKFTEINAKVFTMRLSPGKRSRQDFIEDSDNTCSPFFIFKDVYSMDLNPHALINTPSQKVVDFAHPDQRHIWDKENYDQITKQYSTDRKKKKIKGMLNIKDDKARVPLADITKNNHETSTLFTESSRRVMRLKKSPNKNNIVKKQGSPIKSVSLLRMR